MNASSSPVCHRTGPQLRQDERREHRGGATGGWGRSFEFRDRDSAGNEMVADVPSLQVSDGALVGATR